MECAKRVKVCDKTKQALGDVSVSKILMSEGEVLVKACEYVCLDENCGVKVWPVIPLKIKPTRKKSPQAYFRASRKDPHKSGCNAEGITRPANATEKRQIRPGSRRRRSAQGPYATRYTERGPKGSTQPGKTNNKERGGAFGQSTTGGYEKSIGDIRNASIASTSIVQKLVEFYENPPDHISRMSLIGVPNCPGQTYATVFRDVKMFAPNDENAGRQFIYYGEIESVKTYGSGVWVQFVTRDRGIRPLGVWISNDLAPRSVRDELLRRIGLEDARFRLYALGVLEPKFSRQKYSIEVTRLGRVWVSLKGEN